MHPFFLAVVKKKLPQILNQMNLKVTPGSCLQITGEQRSVKPICSIKLQSFCQVSFDTTMIIRIAITKEKFIVDTAYFLEKYSSASHLRYSIGHVKQVSKSFEPLMKNLKFF